MQFEFEKLVESILNEISQPFMGHDDSTKRAMATKRYVPGREAGGNMMSQSAKEDEQQAGVSRNDDPRTSLDKFQYLLKVNGKWMGFNRRRGDRGMYPAELVAKAKELGMKTLTGNPNLVKQW